MNHYSSHIRLLNLIAILGMGALEGIPLLEKELFCTCMWVLINKGTTCTKNSNMHSHAEAKPLTSSLGPAQRKVLPCCQ